MPETADADRERIQSRTLWVLGASVALATAGSAAAFAAAAVLGEEITGSDALGGLAAAGLTIGTAAGAIPLARAMSARGRRPGFHVGLLVAGGGAALVMMGALVELYLLVLPGMLLVGVGNAVALAARFAAADLAAPGRRARAIGIVVWAATIGAVLGPTAGLSGAGPVAELIGLPRLAGVYVFVGVALVLAAQVVNRFLRPDPLLLARHGDDAPTVAATPSVAAGWRGITGAPLARLGAGALITAHVVMIAIMTVTPLHLRDGGGGLTLIGLVISVHILGMYAFSPVVGWLADRIGALPVITTGGLFLVLAGELSATSAPDERTQIFVALFLLGIGWNFQLVAGSSLITAHVSSGLRVAAQGFADLAMNAGGAAAGVGAGVVLGLLGFGVLGHVGAVLGALVAVAGILGLLRARGPDPAPSTQ
jgi:MFS family permease